MLTPTPWNKLFVSLIMCLSPYECECLHICMCICLCLFSALCHPWFCQKAVSALASFISLHFSELSSSPSTKTEEKSKCSLVAHSRMYIIFNNTLYVYVCTVDGRVPKTAYLLLPETKWSDTKWSFCAA